MSEQDNVPSDPPAPRPSPNNVLIIEADGDNIKLTGPINNPIKIIQMCLATINIITDKSDIVFMRKITKLGVIGPDGKPTN